MKISILTHGFANWGGGIDFIRFISSSIACAASNDHIHKNLIIPKNDYKLKIRHSIYPFKQALNQIANGEFPDWKTKPKLSEAYYQNMFSDLSPEFEILQSGSNYTDQLNTTIRLDSDIVLPCLVPPNKNFSLPWIGYLPDFQHRHFPQFFSKQEIKGRNRNFKYMLDNADHLIVNARAVQQDIECFYADHKANIHVLPFSPHPQLNWLTSELDCREKYHINKPYFMISNQFWKHKDHVTAFKAFAQYLQHGGNAILVCTGETNDYRFPNYFRELQDLIKLLEIEQYVRILGHIPKIEQISLLKQSLAIVQPTLFEGGPGGGACYDAIALGVPVIVSNIPVNLEIDCGEVCFFEAGNYISLAQALHQRGDKQLFRPSVQHLMQVGHDRQRRCGEFILNVIEQACVKG